MSSLQITFSFDEIVDPTTLVASALTVQSDINGTDNITFTSLTPENNMASDVITVTIGNQDAIAIKARTGLATNSGNTYISIATGFISDVGARTPNPNSILNDSAVPVNVYEQDVIPPESVAVTVLDINAGILRISANEPLSLDIDFSKIILQQTPTGNASHTLNSGNVSYINSETNLKLK